MQILRFKIENFRNLRVAECDPVPNFMAICGANGCGKSALLEALMTAKEHAGGYGHFTFDQRTVSADADKATISMTLSFTDREREFVKSFFRNDCPETDEVVIEINKGGGAKTIKRSGPVHQLLGYFSRTYGSPGFFDFINAHRQMQKTQLSSWDATFLSDDRAKQTLARSENKFQFTKQYLAGLKMSDLQFLQTSLKKGEPERRDSLQKIREFFDLFFAPMRFNDVYIDTSPFLFSISTPVGEIDIDDLSSGEKEILNIYVRFHQLNPKGAVILFDEADAHLHPDLERRYLRVLKELGKGNQLFLTTHSPEMMMEAGAGSLWTIFKEPLPNNGNQFVKVTDDQQVHETLSELMGSRGIISINQRIIFIEGEDASADREIYEKLYPPNQYNLSFVPAGDSSTVRRTADKVNHLLTSSTGFQQYFSIIDGDIERLSDDPTHGKRLFRLPVYHAENLLLNEELILKATQNLLGVKCPYRDITELSRDLHELILSNQHIKPYSRALMDSRLANIAKEAYDAIYKNQALTFPTKTLKFEDIEDESREFFKKALSDNSWKAKCKGRELIKAFCGKHGFNYQQFRNLLISTLEEPPNELADIIRMILKD